MYDINFLILHSYLSLTVWIPLDTAKTPCFMKLYWILRKTKPRQDYPLNLDKIKDTSLLITYLAPNFRLSGVQRQPVLFSHTCVFLLNNPISDLVYGDRNKSRAWNLTSMNVLDGIHFADLYLMGSTGADNVSEHVILSGITPENLKNVSFILLLVPP